MQKNYKFKRLEDLPGREKFEPIERFRQLPELSGNDLLKLLQGDAVDKKVYTIQRTDFKSCFDKTPALLQAIALEGDPLLIKKFERLNLKDLFVSELRGAVCLNGFTFVMFEDKDDGYRSGLRTILVFPGQQCITQLHTGIDVYVKKAQDERENVLELYSPDVDKTLVRFGTNNSDEYYPNMVFFMDTENIDAAVRWSSRQMMKEETDHIQFAKRSPPRL